jgi:cell division protein FtsQ
LQQVATASFAAVEIVDPRKLPVPIPHLRRRASTSLRRAWVLHRRLVLRGIAAVFVLLIAVGVWEMRGALASVGTTLTRVVQGEFAAAGFAITEIKVTGQNLTSDADIGTVLALATGGSTITFDPALAQARLNWLKAVDHATVRKVYPNQIIVEITEKDPVLRWRIGDTTWLVDNQGRSLARDPGGYTELPLVVGTGAADDALVMISSLGRHQLLKKDLAALSRIGDRRWDLIYYTGLRVQLPEIGVAQALDRLEMYQRDYAILDRDVTLIDMRIPGMVSVKPTVREDTDGETTEP